MRIKHIFLQNFCKFYGSNVVDTDLYDRTEVSGVNETGKSTIKRAIQYILDAVTRTAERSPESDRTIRTAMTLTEILPQKLPWRLTVQTRF